MMDIPDARTILRAYGLELYVARAEASELPKRIQAVHPRTQKRIDLMSYWTFTHTGRMSFAAIVAREIRVQL